MSDFLDQAYALHRRRAHGTLLVQGAFDDVFDAVSELQAVHAKSHLDLDNIEVLFGAIEMAGVTGKFAERSPGEIAELRRSIVTLIVKTLERSIQFPVREERVVAPHAYNAFAGTLKQVQENADQHDPAEFAFFTFNYDVALDHALQSHRLPYDYCLTPDQDDKKSPYLKLHGSINWGTCQMCNEIVPYYTSELQWNLRPESTHVFFELGSNLERKSHCEKPLNSTPVIVPPTWNKTEYHSKLSNVWKRATAELATAENILVIGYSLPETDLFFRYLFALGTESRTRIRRFWVFDIDNTGTVQSRFERLIGADISSRFRYWREGFESSMGLIKSALESP